MIEWVIWKIKEQHTRRSEKQREELCSYYQCDGKRWTSLTHVSRSVIMGKQTSAEIKKQMNCPGKEDQLWRKAYFLAGIQSKNFTSGLP